MEPGQDETHNAIAATRWRGGLSAAQWEQQEAFTQGVQEGLAAGIGGHAGRDLWTKEASAIRQALIDENRFIGALWVASLERPSLRTAAGVQYQFMLNALLEVGLPVVVEGRLMSAEAGTGMVGLEPARASAERLARRVLEALGEPDDEWRRYLVLGLLVEPRLAAWARPLAPSLVPRGSAEPQSRRDLRLPDRTPQSVGRGGLQMHSALQAEHGVDGRAVQPRRPGSYRPSDARRCFTEYVVKRRRDDNISVQMITTDAEAARLYRAWKPGTEVLTERAVRSALARAEESSE